VKRALAGVAALLVLGCTGCASTPVKAVKVADCVHGFHNPPGRTNICVPDTTVPVSVPSTSEVATTTTSPPTTLPVAPSSTTTAPVTVATQSAISANYASKLKVDEGSLATNQAQLQQDQLALSDSSLSCSMAQGDSSGQLACSRAESDQQAVARDQQAVSLYQSIVQIDESNLGG
jgi:hypothetical protein